METKLKKILSGQIPIQNLTVIYDDLSEFHRNGSLFAVKGCRLYVIDQKYHGRMKMSGTISQAQAMALVQLLIQMEAWQQRADERVDGLDETYVRLQIQAGNCASDIRELYDDLEKNARLIKIRELLVEFWKKSADQKVDSSQLQKEMLCQNCNQKIAVPTENAGVIEIAKAALTDLKKYKAIIDLSDYCRACKVPLRKIRTEDFRDIPEYEKFGYNVKVLLTVPGSDLVFRLWLSGIHVPGLVAVLNGKYDSVFQDSRADEDEIVGGDMDTRKFRNWYRAFRKKADKFASAPQQIAVEPTVLDFGKVKYDQPVSRMLRLINPGKKTLCFHIHGVIGVIGRNFKYMSEIFRSLPYTFDLTHVKDEEFCNPAKRWDQFVVAPRSELIIPIVVRISRDTPLSDDELQITTYYHPSDKPTGDRFTVKISHQGPHGWQE